MAPQVRLAPYNSSTNSSPYPVKRLRETIFYCLDRLIYIFSIMGTRIYTNPPRFFKGHSIVLAFNVIAGIGTLLNAFWMRRENRRKDCIEHEYAERNLLHPHIVDNATLEDVQDQHISFRYIV